MAMPMDATSATTRSATLAPDMVTPPCTATPMRTSATHPTQPTRPTRRRRTAFSAWNWRNCASASALAKSCHASPHLRSVSRTTRGLSSPAARSAAVLPSSLPPSAEPASSFVSGGEATATESYLADCCCCSCCCSLRRAATFSARNCRRAFRFSSATAAPLPGSGATLHCEATSSATTMLGRRRAKAAVSFGSTTANTSTVAVSCESSVSAAWKEATGASSTAASLPSVTSWSRVWPLTQRCPGRPCCSTKLATALVAPKHS